MAYQGLLLSDRPRLRTESIEEHATPNSSPAQWPGENFSVFFLSFFIFFEIYLAILLKKLPTDFLNVVGFLCGFGVFFVFDDVFCHRVST